MALSLAMSLYLSFTILGHVLGYCSPPCCYLTYVLFPVRIFFWFGWVSMALGLPRFLVGESGWEQRLWRFFLFFLFAFESLALCASLIHCRQ